MLSQCADEVPTALYLCIHVYPQVSSSQVEQPRQRDGKWELLTDLEALAEIQDNARNALKKKGDAAGASRLNGRLVRKVLANTPAHVQTHAHPNTHTLTP